MPTKTLLYPDSSLAVAPDRILRHTDVCARLGIGKSTLFAMVARNIFPEPFQIIPGGRAVGWLEADVVKWIESRREQSRGGGAA